MNNLQRSNSRGSSKSSKHSKSSIRSGSTKPTIEFPSRRTSRVSSFVCEAEALEDDNMSWGRPSSYRSRISSLTDDAQMIDDDNISWGKPEKPLMHISTLSKLAESLEDENVAWGKPPKGRRRFFWVVSSCSLSSWLFLYLYPMYRVSLSYTHIIRIVTRIQSKYTYSARRFIRIKTFIYSLK